MSHTHQTTMAALMPLFQEQWSVGASVRFSPSGVSMLPMLRQGKDSVVLSPLPARLDKYALPLYQRDDGKFILHRIVAVEDDHYICMGDNQTVPEIVYPRQLLAVVTAFYRGERQVSMQAWEHRLYCLVLLPFWRLYRRCRFLFGRIKRRLLR